MQTPSVTGHLRNLARAALLRRHPILLQVRGSNPVLAVRRCTTGQLHVQAFRQFCRDPGWHQPVRLSVFRQVTRQCVKRDSTDCFQSSLGTDTVAQGPTSSGKTSLVAYLAAQTGHEFVRINNHQGTDLQVRHFSPV